MKVGDIVICKSKEKACIIETNNTHVTVILLKVGAYMPEVFRISEVEVIGEGE